MKLFFRLTLAYAGVSILVTGLVRGISVDLVIEALAATIAFGITIWRTAMWLVPLFALVLLVIGRRRVAGKLGMLGYAVAGSVLFQVGFSFLKSTMPMVVPFYADAALAEADHWLHGGNDPWVIAHILGAYLPVDGLLPFYLPVWLVPAIGLPVVLAVADDSDDRRARFLALYMFCWIFLGNALAFAGSSVGPIYYDALLGSDRFAPLLSVLRETGIAEGEIGMVQDRLWAAYADSNMALGLGISAFPSVHLAVATMTALYMAERSRWLVLPGMMFIALILFLSVYTGYHYAVDGYFSILVVAAAWALLRRVRLTAIEWRPRRLRAERAPATHR